MNGHIAYPVGEDAKSTTTKPIFEAVEVELEADESRPNRPVSADTVSQGKPVSNH
jgi:hypothetical protein